MWSNDWPPLLLLLNNHNPPPPHSLWMSTSCLLQHLITNPHLNSYPRCPPRRSLASLTILAPPSLQFSRAILPMHLTQKLIGRRKNSIISWAVGSSETINISSKSVGMANGSMAASFHHLLALMLLFQRPKEEGHWILLNTAILMPCTWISHLATVSPLADFVMPSSLSTKPHDTICDGSGCPVCPS
jgi:hypothetical protein